MKCPRASHSEEAFVPKEFMIADDLHRDEARAPEDNANVTASQISRSKMSSYGYLQNVEKSPIPDLTAGNFETEAENERRRLEEISLGILNDPSANLSKVPRISPVASPGRYSGASKHLPAGRYSSTGEEEQEKTPSCESPTRSAYHGSAHYHAGGAAIKRPEENVDRLSGLVEVLQDNCKCHQSHKEEANKTTQIPEEVPVQTLAPSLEGGPSLYIRYRRRNIYTQNRDQPEELEQETQRKTVQELTPCEMKLWICGARRSRLDVVKWECS